MHAREPLGRVSITALSRRRRRVACELRLLPPAKVPKVPEGGGGSPCRVLFPPAAGSRDPVVGVRTAHLLAPRWRAGPGWGGVGDPADVHRCSARFPPVWSTPAFRVTLHHRHSEPARIESQGGPLRFSLTIRSAPLSQLDVGGKTKKTAKIRKSGSGGSVVSGQVRCPGLSLLAPLWSSRPMQSSRSL